MYTELSSFRNLTTSAFKSIGEFTLPKIRLSIFLGIQNTGKMYNQHVALNDFQVILYSSKMS